MEASKPVDIPAPELTNPMPPAPVQNKPLVLPDGKSAAAIAQTQYPELEELKNLKFFKLFDGNPTEQRKFVDYVICSALQMDYCEIRRKSLILSMTNMGLSEENANNELNNSISKFKNSVEEITLKSYKVCSILAFRSSMNPEQVCPNLKNATIAALTIQNDAKEKSYQRIFKIETEAKEEANSMSGDGRTYDLYGITVNNETFSFGIDQVVKKLVSEFEQLENWNYLLKEIDKNETAFKKEIFLDSSVIECPKTTYKTLFDSIFANYNLKFEKFGPEQYIYSIVGSGLTADKAKVDANLKFLPSFELRSYTLTSSKSGMEVDTSQAGFLSGLKTTEFMKALCKLHFKE